MANSSSDDAPHLSAFLQVRLVELGLDYDTYGPYVLGIEVGNNDIDIDNDDDIDNDEEAQEQVDQVCQYSKPRPSRKHTLTTTPYGRN